MGRTAEDDARWFVVSDDAARSTVEATVRGALLAQRGRLARVYVDVGSDDEWPTEVHASVRAAERRLATNRHGDDSLTLDPRVDEDFDIALALAPFSIGCSGVSSRGELVWDVSDTGTSAAFTLTPAEVTAVRSAIARSGGRADDLVTLTEHRLCRRAFSYGVVGGTAPAVEPWQPPDGWRAYEHTVRLGTGADLWDEASAAVLTWGIKTRSGFAVDPLLEPGRVAHRGERYWLVARIGPARVREPVEIVVTLATHRRVALAYGTLEGHPVAGEEAFIVHRDDDGNVSLTLRSLTRPGRGRWRGLFPLILVAQRWYRRRYQRALVRGAR